MKENNMKVVSIILSITFIGYLSACTTTSNDKEVEQLRKEVELSKREAELARKELELAKSQPPSTPSPTPSNANPTSNVENTQADAQINLINVRLRLLTQGAIHYSPYGDLLVTLETKGKILRGKTDAKGWVMFKEVPCGELIKITSPNFELQNGKVWQVKRNLPCTNPQVVLGSYSDMSGDLLTKEDLKYILK